MTEKLQTLSTQIAPPSQSLFALSPPVTAAIPQDVLQKVETVEEEPYTIKCICNFPDDDGNTIYCETCDTWQHIECYYPDNVDEAYREDFAHSCVECKPRPLNRQQAFDRQHARLSLSVVEETATDKKPKRPPSKSHKKKPKPTEISTNGHTSGNEAANKHGSPQDGAPPKKVKTSHKPSHSVSSQAAKRSPSHGTSRSHPHGHPPSPATTPPDLPSDLEIHAYSPGFLALYSDNDVQISESNSFANLMISNTMSLWLREPQRLREETGQEYGDVFQDLPPNMDASKTTLNLQDKKLALTPGTVLRWQYLTMPSAVEKDKPLIELNGQIGLQRDYCETPENRWNEMSSPLPFVFFHPALPLYIDTRKEGSKARYVRRSCKPNAVLDTFLSDGSEYHFWLVSDRAIAANEQITIPWDFRFPKKDSPRMLHLLGLGDDPVHGHDDVELDDAEYQSVAAWLHLILSEYGGCACDLGSECAFARFHRSYYGRTQPRSRSQPPKKRPRKPKAQAISPTSTGHATNSRAASEGHLDDGPENDVRSASESRSKPPSRDMTPARQGSFDTLGILTEPTDRDKRKVAMVEDSFRRMEQQQLPPRKKKRVSDGNSSGSSKSKPGRNSTSQASGAPNGIHERKYVDAGTSRSKSGSPSSMVSPSATTPFRQMPSRPGSIAARSRQTSVAPTSNYCDAAVQTDPVDGEWYSGSPEPTRPKRRIVSLSRRLLGNCYRMRQDEEGKRKQQEPVPAQDASVMDVDSPTSEHKVPPDSPVLTKENLKPTMPLPTPGDMPMPDAPCTSPGLGGPTIKTSPDLRVQMPPVPAFGPPGVTMSATTPLSASGSMVQSPFASSNLPGPFGPPAVNGIAVSPSPVKKKWSLSDYKSRMNKAGGAGRPPPPPPPGTNSPRPSASNAEEPKSATTSVDAPPTVDSPTTADKTGDGATSKANAPVATTQAG